MTHKNPTIMQLCATIFISPSTLKKVADSSSNYPTTGIRPRWRASTVVSPWVQLCLNWLTTSS